MKEIGLWLFLGGTLVLSGCGGGKPGTQEERMHMEDARPNIVLIMADDMGHEVLGSYGGTSYHTPNLDKLAASGMRFTHCYSAPKCAPSRVKLMTGRYAFRTTREWGYIPPEEITFGHMLDSAGYAVALAGKWQMALLKEEPDHIRKMGFGESSVFGWHEGPRYHAPYIYQNGKILEGVKDQYGPDIFCDFLIEFIRRNQDQTFFAYYPMALAHEISNDLETPPPTAPNGRYQSYGELVEYADVLVGRLVQALDEMGLRENTLIIFTGDNGTPRSFITEFKDGEYLEEPVFSQIGDSVIAGGKNLLTDAGTHVPLIASWPGVIQEESKNDWLVDFSDFLPTLAEISGAKIPDVTMDGKSFAAAILGEQGSSREWVYQEHEGKAWVRNRRWKLYRDGRLVDVPADPLEEEPYLAGQEPDSLATLRQHFESILNQMQ